MKKMRICKPFGIEPYLRVPLFAAACADGLTFSSRRVKSAGEVLDAFGKTFSDVKTAAPR